MILRGGDDFIHSGLFADAFNGNAGDITIEARSLTVADSAQVSSTTSGSGQGGKITLTADTIELRGSATFVERFFGGGVTQSGVFADTTSVGNAGDITIEAQSLTVADGAQVSSSTNGAGQGGNITVRANTIELRGRDPGTAPSVFQRKNSEFFPSGVFAGAFGDTSGVPGEVDSSFDSIPILGNAGDIFIEARKLTVADSAQVSSRTVGAGSNAGSVTLQVEELFSSNGGTVSSEAAQGAGGNITVTAGELRLTNGTTISAESTGSKNAGDITLTSSGDLFIQDSSVRTVAKQSSGGNIKLTTPSLIQLIDSTLESSVQGNALTQGGNINVDPDFIIMQNNRILATATSGFGGNIDLIGNVILMDPFSTIDASSQFGISGSVNLQAPIQNLSGTIAPLPEAILEAAALYSAKCTGQKGGTFSSFTVQGRDRIPVEPDEMLATPLNFSTLMANRLPASGQVLSPMAQRFSLPNFEGSLFSQNLRDLFYGGCHS